MENINFSSLAPRVGTRPMMSTWNDIGISSMNGGAFSWGSIWSGLKNFGSSAKSFGTKVWNSSTGVKLRQKLKDTNAQDKLVDGIAAGIHGALDIANQEVAKAIDKRLDRPMVSVEEKEPQVEEIIEESKEIGGKKRPLEDEEIVTKIDAPPSYDEIFGTKDAPPLLPMTRPVHPMARPVVPPTLPPSVDVPTTLDLPPPPSPTIVKKQPVPVQKPAQRPVIVPAATAPSFSFGAPKGWQSTLGSIVGAGVRAVKRRRCYR